MLGANFFKLLLHFSILSLHSLELCSQSTDLACWQSQVLLSIPDFVAERSILSQQLLNPLLVRLRLLRKSTVFVSGIGELTVESVGLLSGKSHGFLSFLDLTSQGSDLCVSLLDKSIESLALLSKNVDFVLVLSFHSLPGIFSVDKLFLCCIQFSTDSLELSLKFVESTSWQSQVFLSSSDLVTESSILSQQLLNFLLVGVDLLSWLTELASVVVEFSTESLGLLSWQSDVLLCLLDLSAESSDLIVLFLNDLVESLDLVGHGLSVTVRLSLESLPGSLGFS